MLWAKRSRVQILVQEKYFFLLCSIHTGSVAHPAPYSIGNRALFPGGKADGVKLITHLHLMPWLRMNGATAPCPPYAFILYTGTTLPKLINLNN